MRAPFRSTLITYGVVALVCLTIGLGGTLVAQPLRYGVPANDLAEMLRSEQAGSLYFWCGYSVLILFAALARARHVAARKPWVKWTKMRGSIWLWGAIGGPWLYAGMPWTYMFEDFATQHTTAAPLLFSVAMWWWLGAVVSLVVGPCWSAWIAATQTPIPPSVASSSPLSTLE